MQCVGVWVSRWEAEVEMGAPEGGGWWGRWSQVCPGLACEEAASSVHQDSDYCVTGELGSNTRAKMRCREKVRG